MMRLQRIAATVACALSLAFPASAQLIGSGHVLGNGTGSLAAPTDTPLLQILNQPGSGLSVAGTTTTLATVNGTIASGHCRSTDASGNDVDSGGPCPTGLAFPCQPFNGSTSSSDNWPALSAQINAAITASATGVCIQVPPGSFEFQTTGTITYPATPFRIQIVGSGKNATEFWFHAENGPSYVDSNVQTHSWAWRDLSINTDDTTSHSFTGLNIKNLSSTPVLTNAASSDMSRISFGCHTPLTASCYWSAAYFLSSQNNVQYNNVDINNSTNSGVGNGGIIEGNHTSVTGCTGTNGATSMTCSSLTGVLVGMFAYDDTTVNSLASNAITSIVGSTVNLTSALTGNVSSGDTITFTNASIIHNFKGGNWNNLAQGEVISVGVQGVTFSDGYNFTGGGLGVIMNGDGIVQVAFDSTGQWNVNHWAILANSTVRGPADVLINGGEFFSTDTSGSFPAIALQGVDRFVISGINCLNVGSSKGTSNCVSIGTSSGPFAGQGMISGSTFNNFNIGIGLAATAHNINIQSNNYPNSTTQISNSGGTACPPTSSGNCLGGGSQ